MPHYDQVTIVGVGLLGGSAALAVKDRGLAAKVVGVGRNRQKLDEAVSSGLIDRGSLDLSDGVAEASLVLVCTPVEMVATTVLEVLEHAPEGCLVTDVGSSKQAIVAEVAAGQPKVEISRRFVGSHPLAGDHRSGAGYARGDLFVGRTVVVTPGQATAAAERIAEFWQALGAKVLCMSPAEHDAALAATSHVPHLVASALAACTPDDVLPLAATGWCDTTRIAAADPALWRQIFASNRKQVLAALDHFDQHLAELRAAMAAEEDNKLEQLLAEGKRIRDAVGN